MNTSEKNQLKECADVFAANASLFGDLMSESLQIRTHIDFMDWAQGTVQEFLPHDLLIAAWGDFELGIIYYDIFSLIPGACTDIMPEKEMTSFLKRLYAYWMSKDREASQLLGDQSVIRCRDIHDRLLKSSMQNMKTALVDAIKDVRGGSDSFYVLLSSNPDITPCRRKIFHQLLPYIDATLRQIEHLPAHAPEVDSKDYHPHDLGVCTEIVSKLSDREYQIMEWVCSGKTNVEIGMILDISVFTVKNHLQRIFKKLDVVNRSQAVAKIRGTIFSY
jgi:transcriptional regulator EpsA